MNKPDSSSVETIEERKDSIKVDLLNRIIAKTIDLIIVGALYEIIPKVGYFAGLTYLLIADGLFQGRSVGKRLIGLKVIILDSAGLNPVCGFRESIFRNFPLAAGYILFGILNAIPLIGWIFSFVVAAAILLFESLVILGSEEGMRLGDELARTRVIEDKQGGLNV